MGLFASKGKPGSRRSGGTTIIARGTTLSGDLVPEGNLHIDGRIEGQIDSASDVSIGAEGSFEGEIHAHRMVVSGFARGRIECDSLEIVDKGRVVGEVSSRSLVIEPGGQFVGESRGTDEEAVAQLGHWDGPGAVQNGAAGERRSQEPASAPKPEPTADEVVVAKSAGREVDEPVVTELDEQVDSDEEAREAGEPTVGLRAREDGA